MSSESSSARKSQFKATPGLDRSRREEKLVGIRKEKRQLQFHQKRRAIDEEPPLLAAAAYPAAFQERLARLPEVLAGLRSPSFEVVKASLIHIRQLVSIRDRPPFEHILPSLDLILPYISAAYDAYPDVQENVLWILTNIASSEEPHVCAHVGRDDIMSAMMRFVTTPGSVEALASQAVWAFANVVSDSVEIRDKLLAMGILDHIMTIATRQGVGPMMMRNIAFCCVNLVRGTPVADPHRVLPTLPAWLQLLVPGQQTVVLVDLCLAVMFVMKGGPASIDAVILNGYVPRMIALLEHPEEKVVLRALVNCQMIAGGSDAQTEELLRQDFLKAACVLLSNPFLSIRKGVVFAIANICAGTSEQVERVARSTILQQLVEDVLVHDSITVQREVCHVVLNTCITNSALVSQFLSYDLLSHLKPLMTTSDTETIRVILDIVRQILRAGEDAATTDDVRHTSRYADLLFESGMVEWIQKLQEHEQEDVYARAFTILCQYFVVEEGAPGPEDEFGSHLLPSSASAAP